VIYFSLAQVVAKNYTGLAINALVGITHARIYKVE
jgi:hypothetical protein